MLPNLDLLTRKWWRAVGRPVDLAGEHAWLDAPMSSTSTVGAGWVQEYADRIGGSVRQDVNAGLVTDFELLSGPGFDARSLQPQVRDFYEHTAQWRMEAWAEWSPWFWPGGEAVSRLFGKRVEQLALPMRPLDVSRGMDSSVEVITDREGHPVATGWLRTLRSTGEFVFSGCYSHRTLPGADRPSVHVAFPLESGNVQVFLRPSIDPDGSLWLRSPGDPFGGDGAYVVVEDGGRHFAARAPIHETFHVYVDPVGVLRTDHVLKLWEATAVRLHYKLEPRNETQFGWFAYASMDGAPSTERWADSASLEPSIVLSDGSGITPPLRLMWDEGAFLWDDHGNIDGDQQWLTGVLGLSSDLATDVLAWRDAYWEIDFHSDDAYAEASAWGQRGPELAARLTDELSSLYGDVQVRYQQ